MNHANTAPAASERTPQHIAKFHGPHDVDVHVGSRIRMRRLLLSLSQEVLAGKIGLTFQQIQKYERGTNRVSASKLYEIAKALSVPVSFFFDGMEDDDTPTDENAISTDELRVLVALNKLEPKRRRAVLTFLEEGM